MFCMYGCCIASCCCILVGVLPLILLHGLKKQVDPRVQWACAALVGLYFLYYTVKSFFAAEVHRADDAARLLFQKQGGKTPDLPAKLKGVFWFSTNAAPELLTCFEGQWFDPERRLVNFKSGGTYSWSFSTGLVGWIYWFFLRVSYMFCSELHLKFEDEDYTFAKMNLYTCGCCKDGSCCDGCWVPMGQWWTMRQREDDENTWDRDITLYCMPCWRWEMGSYVLKRVIDQGGQELPAFAEMMDSLERGEKVKGVNRKPMQQILNGDDWKGHFCFGQGGNPDVEQPPTESLSAALTS